LAQARLSCRTRSLEHGPGRRELRLACDADSTRLEATLEGHVILADDVPNAGMIGRLALDGHAPLSRLVVAGGSHRREADTETMQLRLRESGWGLRARLASGEQLAPLQLRIGPDGEAAIELRTVDDLAPLRTALAGMVEAALADADAALGAGPLRRRAVLDELAAALER
jgi:hypothetical protein